PPPMVTPVEKRSSNKFCDFHNDKGHSTDECMQLKKQIKELARAEKLSHLIKEIKQGRDQSKAGKKETVVKDKPTTIYMVQSWQRTVKQKVTQSFERVGEIAFPQLAAIPSTVYGMLKFPVEGGIATIRSTILIPTECASVTTSSVIPREERTGPANFKVALHPDFPDQEVVIEDHYPIRDTLKHRLNIREGYSPVRQKKRGQAPERAKAIQAKVQKLVEAGIMREVYYHDWLSNPVMVKRHDGSWRMCVDFMDLNKAYAYKGYHQIQLAEANEEKTAFHTRQRVYCYTKMPFGLKNAGATYQRLMDKAFEGQMGRNIEVYVDDLVVKSHTEAEMVRDTEETFRTLRKSNFHWTTEAEQAFQQLKQHLSELPLLVAPKPQEELIMYLSTTYGAISAVLTTPIYFISRALQGPELNYSPMKKLVLSLIFAAKRLQRYFQAHPIVVITDQPIKQVMSRLDMAGRLQKWSIMPGEHNITYRPMTSVKGQILADFLIEMPGDASQAGPTVVYRF
nr:reverse transcriptase domain-containing protein [Tanacetum cinerariifolium]